jgi:hypothetical protein
VKVSVRPIPQKEDNLVSDFKNPTCGGYFALPAATGAVKQQNPPEM